MPTLEENKEKINVIYLLENLCRRTKNFVKGEKTHFQQNDSITKT